MFNSFVFNGGLFGAGGAPTPIPIATAAGRAYAPNIITSSVIFVEDAATAVAMALDPICVNETVITLADPATASGLAIAPVHSYVLSHGIHEGRYRELPMMVNRVYVVGLDRDANMVYGESKDSALISEYGERFVPYADSLIDNTADALEVAANIRAKARLNETLGVIRIPPNIGQELWDVVNVNDSPCAQVDAKYRVSGYQLIFDPRQEMYHHVIGLTAR
jgi:hypothetical protein